MANIEAKNLLVAVKAYSRGNPLPLDASEVYDSLLAAQAYAKEANAYAGQTIKVLEDGKYKSYVLQPGTDGLTLEPVGEVQIEDLKDFVQVIDELPANGEENVLYVVGTTGSIWNDTDKKYDVVFKDVKHPVEFVSELPAADKAEENVLYVVGTTGLVWNPKKGENNEGGYDTLFEDLTSKFESINNTLDTKAPINNPTFTGTVKIDEDEVAVKSYVEGLIANIHSNSPKILDSSNPLPTTKYKAGNTWRVAEAGTYAGQKCEIGDVIICLNDYKADGASDSDFIVVQANVDGAVTSSAEVVTDASIVVFDGVTGKVIKSSEVSIASLNTAIANSHTHTNKTQLDSYDKTQTDLLAAAASNAESQISDFNTNTIQPIVSDVAKKANSADVYTKEEADDLLNNKADSTSVYTKEEINGKIEVIEGNLNSKVATTDFNTKIGDLGDKSVKDFVESAVSDASGDAADYVDSKLGDITDTEGNAQTVKDYVDAGLAKKADKATTLAGYGITDAYTKTEVDTKVSNDIATAKTELTTEIDKKAAQSDLDTVSGKVTTLIGDDENTSVRTIVSTEVAKIINDNDDTDVDTLEEIAAWIAAHPESVAAINKSISDIQKQLTGIDAGEGTVKKYIDDAVAAKDLSAYATIEYVDAQDAATLEAAKAYTDAAMTIVRF